MTASNLREAVERVVAQCHPNEPERETIERIARLTRHGGSANLIVRRDGRDYTFEADWLIRLLRPQRAAARLAEPEQGKGERIICRFCGALYVRSGIERCPQCDKGEPQAQPTPPEPPALVPEGCVAVPVEDVDKAKAQALDEASTFSLGPPTLHDINGRRYEVTVRLECDFHCNVCGEATLIAPKWPARGVCPGHCEDHDYEYDQGERRHSCKYCGQEPPMDWYSE